MVCSPSTLFVDISLWVIPEIANGLVHSYQNWSKGDPYDCGLTSVPCDSNITKALINSDPILVFWFDLIVVYILLTVFVVVGIFGNVTNITIFSTNNIVSDSTNNLILALSVSDLISLLSMIPVLMMGFVCYLDESYALSFFNQVLTQINVITRWFSLLSLDFVTVIAIQKAVAVLFPFKVSSIFSRRNTNIIIAVLCMICMITMAPLNASINPRLIFHPYFDQYIYLRIQLLFGIQFTVKYTSYYYTIRSVVNLVSIFTASNLTAHMFNKQAKIRGNLKAETSTTDTPKMSVRETKAIKVTLAICFVTFTIFSMGILVNIATQVYAEELFKSPLSGALEYTLSLLIAVNSTFNFFLYMKMSEKYREVFCNRFQCHFKK